jgi:hypothetical protein
MKTTVKISIIVFTVILVTALIGQNGVLAEPIIPLLDWTTESNQAEAKYGHSVSTAGDVNGDGYDDVIVGAPFYDNGQTDEGLAYAFYGSELGLSSTPDWVVENDNTNGNFGISVSNAGDVNGDGFDDVIVGAGYFNAVGRAFVYFGSSSGLSTLPDWTAENGQAGSQFGQSVSTAGDVNGDGYADVVIGSFAFDNGQTNEGRIYVYHGSSSGLSTTPAFTDEGNYANGWLGRSVSNAGDINGDGYDDVIVGGPGEPGFGANGRVRVYFGSETGLTLDYWSASTTNGFGTSVNTGGDIDGDGYDEVIVGFPFLDNGGTDAGGAYFYWGSPEGISTTRPYTLIVGNQAGAEFGYAVSSAGDVNNDGYSDVVIGAIKYDHDHVNEGHAFVYLGSSSGISTTASMVLESDNVESKFGAAVDSAGDVNGNGFDSVIIGAYTFTNGQANEGAAFIYRANNKPLANAGEDQSVYRASSVTLNGNGSSDPDGDTPLTYQWTQTGGTTVTLSGDTTASPTFTAPNDPATLTFSLVVTDSLSLTSEADTIKITVNNQAPIANAGEDQSVHILTLVTLDGSLSSDPDGDTPLTYQWTQTGGTTVTLSGDTTANPTFTSPSDPATLTFSLVVTDSLGLESVADVVIIRMQNFQIYFPLIIR